MIWLKEYTDKIRAHIAAGDAASLNYAALEARLALERVCYERLKLSHQYISADDLRRWTPRYVVQTLMELVDPKIASEWTLYISTKPAQEGVPLEAAEYAPLGTQKGFDPAQVSKLWQALSNFLHCSFPRHADAKIEHYAQMEVVKSKLEEVLSELDRLAEGTMQGVLVLKKVSFQCVCGQQNSRPEIALQHDAIINCIEENCTEQYRVEKKDDEFSFERRMIPVECKKCGKPTRVPFRQIDELPRDKMAWFLCEGCEAKNVLMWRLMQRDRTEDG